VFRQNHGRLVPPDTALGTTAQTGCWLTLTTCSPPLHQALHQNWFKRKEWGGRRFRWQLRHYTCIQSGCCLRLYLIGDRPALRATRCGKDFRSTTQTCHPLGGHLLERRGQHLCAGTLRDLDKAYQGTKCPISKIQAASPESQGLLACWDGSTSD
jgi:hypothetical protein